MRRKLLIGLLLINSVSLIPTVAESRSGNNHLRDLENQEANYRHNLSIEESLDLARAHSSDRENLTTALKLIDKQLTWIFENISNLNTPGYKKIAVVQSATGDAKPRRLFYMGSLQSTGNKLDIAISSTEGFFKVLGKRGEVYFRRNGNFKLNQERMIIDSNGFLLTPKIQLGSEQVLETLTINEEGNVRIGTTTNSIKLLGDIKLFHVQNPDNLDYISDCSCFKLQNGSPEPTAQTPGKGDIGGLLQGFLEMSNVNESEERTNQIVLLKQRKVIFATIQMLTPKTPKQSSK